MNMNEKKKEYVLLVAKPNIGKEAGDFYNGEYRESDEELVRCGIIAECDDYGIINNNHEQ